MSLPGSEGAPDVGIFDSGLGGLTVLRALRRQAPHLSVLYLADTANVPYGDKPLAVVRDLALRLTAHLARSGARLVLMASGTSTAAGLDAARALFPTLPLVGTIAPGASAAVARGAGPVGVLSTQATAQSLAFTQAVHALDPSCAVIEWGCPRFVPLVESGRAETPEAEAAAREYLSPLHRAQVRTIILGCTHFPFLLPVLRRAAASFGDPTFRPAFVDPCEEAVRLALPLLPSLPPLPAPADVPLVRFAATGDPAAFRRHASALLGESLPPVDCLRL